MKKYIGLVCVALSLSVAPARAECVADVKVNGLVCDFCARALEKVFGQREEVSGIRVDLDGGVVTVTLKEGKALADDLLTGLITDSGYNVTEITRRGC